MKFKLLKTYPGCVHCIGDIVEDPAYTPLMYNEFWEIQEAEYEGHKIAVGDTIITSEHLYGDGIIKSIYYQPTSSVGFSATIESNTGVDRSLRFKDLAVRYMIDADYNICKKIYVGLSTSDIDPMTREKLFKTTYDAVNWLKYNIPIFTYGDITKYFSYDNLGSDIKFAEFADKKFAEYKKRNNK